MALARFVQDAGGDHLFGGIGIPDVVSSSTLPVNGSRRFDIVGAVSSA
jgi:hypothetical protein